MPTGMGGKDVTMRRPFRSTCGALTGWCQETKRTRPQSSTCFGPCATRSLLDHLFHDGLVGIRALVVAPAAEIVHLGSIRLMSMLARSREHHVAALAVVPGHIGQRVVVWKEAGSNSRAMPSFSWRQPLRWRRAGRRARSAQRPIRIHGASFLPPRIPDWRNPIRDTSRQSPPVR